MKYETHEVGTEKTILRRPYFKAIPTTVPAAGAVEVDGKKIVKAGTILPANDATALGVLLHTKDVTSGDMPGTIVQLGWINLAILAENGITPSAEAKAALPMIVFEEGEV